ncbi:MAG: TonB-dependent receptor domain-containing protein [Janthinobacterium lividum]
MANMFRRNLLASTLLVGATAVAAPALAQTATTPPNAASPAEANTVGASATGVQDAAAAPAAEAGDTGAIVVTGSLIKNPNLKSAAPVQVVGRDEISLRQVNTAEGLLRDLPGVVPSIGTAVNNGNGGASFVDLRGLGRQRNLVLLDGQRITPADITGATDLNNIPLALIERVDLLTGGAATTYGADAVSGVVNFVTRTNFTGIEINSSEQINQAGDGNSFRTDVTIGGNFDEGKGNAVLSIGYQKADPVSQGDRPYSEQSVESYTGGAGGSGTSIPARFTRPGSSTQQINTATGMLTPTYQLFNYNPYNLFQTPFKRFNIFGEAHYDASDHVTFYTRGMFSKNTVGTILAPGGAFAAPDVINYNNPYLPAAAAQQFCASNGLSVATCNAAIAATGPTDPNYKTFSTSVSRRTPELGNRVSNDTTTLFDYKAGVRFNIFNSMSLDVGGNYGQSENNQVTTGNLRVSRLRDASLASLVDGVATCNSGTTGCVPVDLFGPEGSITAAQAAYLAGPTEVTEKTSLVQAHALLTGDFGVSSPFASSPISFAVGGEYRKYTASQVSDVLSQQAGEISGSGGAAPNINGAYEVTEGYGELSAPLVNDKPFAHSLTAEAGIRYSHYKIDTAGSPTFNTTTYKGGGTWEPVQGVQLRGNYQHAVRAPSISELFSPRVTSLTNLASDPCASVTQSGAAIAGTSAPTGALRDVCLAQGATAANVNLIANDPGGQINATGGGNTNLKPEKSNSFTGGIVLTPTQILPGFSFTVDYFHIKITDAITDPTPGDAIAACFGSASTANGGAGLPAGAATSAACDNIRRDPVTGELSGDAATVQGIPLTLSNLGTLKTDGIDLTANYRRDFGFAKLNLSFNGTWTHSNTFKSGPTSVNRECVGYYSINCLTSGSPQPEFTWNTRATVTVKAVDLSVLWRHLSKLKQEPLDVAADGPGFDGTNAEGTSFDAQKIKAFNYFDLSLRTVVGDNLELTLTVQNLMNKKPPIVGTDIGNTAFNSGNTFPSLYDTLGRRFEVGAQVKF